MRSRLFILLLGLVLGVAATRVLTRPGGPLPLAVAADPAPAEAALERPIAEVWLENVPLDEALRRLERAAGFPIRLDTNELEVAGIDAASRPVTLRARNVPLHAALADLLAQAGGAIPVLFEPGQDAIVVSTRQSRRLARVYDVADMTSPLLPGTPGKTIQSCWGTFTTADQTMADDFVRLVVETISPDAWRTNGGTDMVEHLGGRLVVVSTWQNHRMLRSLLAQLREPAGPTTPPVATSDVQRWHEGVREWIPEDGRDARAALGKRLGEVKLQRVPFDAALDRLAAAAGGAKLYPKWPELEASRFNRERPVSVSLVNPTLAEALDALTAAAGEEPRVTYEIEAGVITICPRGLDLDRVATETLVYDVRDWLEVMLRAERSRLAAERPHGFPVPSREAIVEELINIVRSSVVPETWREVGGTVGSIRELGGFLIVTQSVPNQERVRRLLNALRAAGTLPTTRTTGK